MTIRNRLKLTGLVPISFLIALSTYFFISSYLNYEKANTLKIALTNNAKLDNLLIQLGKERGLTSLYLATNKESFTKPLQSQYLKTDKEIQAVFKLLEEDTNDLYISQLSNEEKVDNAILLRNNLSSLSQTRKSIEKENIDFTTIFFDEYSKKYNTPTLNTLLAINNYTLNTQITSLIISLSQLYISKENAGTERGFVAYFVEKKMSMSFDEIALWSGFKTKANLFNIDQISDPQLKNEINQILSNDETKALLKALGETSSAIQTDIDNGDYAEEAVDWFTLQTQKITLLTKIELIISNALWEKSNAFLEQQLLLLAIAAAILLLSFTLAFLGYLTTKDITMSIQSLEDVLNKAVEEMKGSDQYLLSDTEIIENIDLDTYEGTKEAYRFLENLVDTAKQDKLMALQANEAKSLFLANMSHEIRTPLNGIVGFTEILRNTPLDGEQQEFLNIIDKSSENLLSIINNILDLSKIESNKVEIENIIFDALIEFQSTAENYAVAAAEKNIDLNFYMDPSITQKLKGDPTKIKEVLINLLSNAIKFTGFGGQINLEIRKVTNNDNRSAIFFNVQDNGIGMTKDQQARIFDAFSQADVSVTRKYGGTGLGLTISKQFVELLGGKLELESTKDHGTSFFFTLPLEEVIGNEQSLAKAFNNTTIAIFEHDVPTKLDSYTKNYFEHFGVHTRGFRTVADLKELLDQGDCNSFWIDIDKVGQNILDAIKHLNKTNFIVLSNVTSRDKVEILNIPQDQVTYKPFTLTKVKALLNRVSNVKDHIRDIVELTPKHQSSTFNASALVTEDNIINQKLITRILEKHGIRVDIANNGLESFEKRRSGTYDIVFMDIQMPVMDGIEATHEILDFEQDEGEEHVPIIALTANALKGDRERFLAEGIDEYITKPIETSELLYILNKFLSHKAVNETVQTTPEVTPTAPTPQPKAPEVSQAKIEVISIAPTPSKIDKEEIKIEPLRRKILIAKKLGLEGRVIAKLLDNLNESYTILGVGESVERLILSNGYDILITDESLATDTIRQMSDRLKIVTERVSKKDEITAIINTHRR